MPTSIATIAEYRNRSDVYLYALFHDRKSDWSGRLGAMRFVRQSRTLRPAFRLIFLQRSAELDRRTSCGTDTQLRLVVGRSISHLTIGIAFGRRFDVPGSRMPGAGRTSFRRTRAQLKIIRMERALPGAALPFVDAAAARCADQMQPHVIGR